MLATNEGKIEKKKKKWGKCGSAKLKIVKGRGGRCQTLRVQHSKYPFTSDASLKGKGKGKKKGGKGGGRISTSGFKQGRKKEQNNRPADREGPPATRKKGERHIPLWLVNPGKKKNLSTSTNISKFLPAGAETCRRERRKKKKGNITQYHGAQGGLKLEPWISRILFSPGGGEKKKKEKRSHLGQSKTNQRWTGKDF